MEKLYTVSRVPEELWPEVHDIVQEAGIKTTPQKRMGSVQPKPSAAPSAPPRCPSCSSDDFEDPHKGKTISVSY